MRIAIVSWSRRRAGGAETYLASVVPALVEAGHAVGLWFEQEGPADRETIDASHDPQAAIASDVGRTAWLAGLREWRPNVIYAHGLTDPELEAALDAAPVAFFAHSYYGTCVSGSKTWKSPAVRPCTRRFGPGCFAHYYPHRCGGLSPLRMVSEYRIQARRLTTLRGFAAIATASSHMRREYLAHGFDADRVTVVPLPVSAPTVAPAARTLPTGNEPWRLVFAGRMDRLKGGARLLASLVTVQRRVGRPLHLTLLGDGPERPWLERAASKLARAPGLSVEFTGWVGAAKRDEVFAQSDLFVMPSLWPEPFGLGGLEAGHFGVPSAAFAVGGIPEWLRPEVNGHLAPPPSVSALGEAIARCLDPARHATLRRGAVEAARRFSMRRHLDALTALFDEVVA